MASLPDRSVVTCFLESESKILLLRRSERVGSYQGRWAGVSGYIEKPPDEQALTEIEEETGLSGKEVTFIKRGKFLTVDDEATGVRWIVHPYLFHIEERDKISIDWEHQEFRWVDPKEINAYQVVPGLKEALARVYQS